MKNNAKITLSNYIREEESLSSYILSKDGALIQRYFITSEDSDNLTESLAHTLHTLLLHGYNEEQIELMTGMVKEEKCKNFKGGTCVDFGYILPEITFFIPNVMSYEEALLKRTVYVVKDLDDKIRTKLCYATDDTAAFHICHPDEYKKNSTRFFIYDFSFEDEFISI